MNRWFATGEVPCRQRCLVRTLLVSVVAWLLVAIGPSAVVHGGYLVGLDFLDAPVYNAAVGGVFPTSTNFGPYDFFAASTPFATALSGLSPQQFEGRVVGAVQEIFRDAEINLPGEMLNSSVNEKGDIACR